MNDFEKYYIMNSSNDQNKSYANEIPSICHGTLHRAQWTTSNTFPGKGSLFVPITADIAGIPRSSANCT